MICSEISLIRTDKKIIFKKIAHKILRSRLLIVKQLALFFKGHMI